MTQGHKSNILMEDFMNQSIIVKIINKKSFMYYNRILRV